MVPKRKIYYSHLCDTSGSFNISETTIVISKLTILIIEVIVLFLAIKTLVADCLR